MFPSEWSYSFNMVLGTSENWYEQHARLGFCNTKGVWRVRSTNGRCV